MILSLGSKNDSHLMSVLWCGWTHTYFGKINAQFHAEAKFWTFHLTSDMNFGHAKQ